ncbi:hypothetical protein DH2020_021595 [Rehmannia glutinosa]|uniref:CCHC-type domain-containing protein n=1 Tax=Rehmannia glutinosa TaxID=99300 RepID=A0ABR0WF53_REHGL
MKNTLVAIWRPVKGVFIKDLGPNLFLFQFFHELDLARVQSNGPWTFDNLMLITKRLLIGEQPSKVLLFNVEIWVQVYDLPFGFMTEKVGESIGNFIGSYVEADQHSFSGVWQNYMRIRVAFDVRTPLKRRMKLKKAGGDWLWINLKYERLPTFCFYCGLIGHSDKFCANLFNCSKVPMERAYGSWLRAPSRKVQNHTGSQWLRSSCPETVSVQGNKDDDGYSSDYPSDYQDPNFQETENRGAVTDEIIRGKDVTVTIGNNKQLSGILNSNESGKGKEIICSENKRRSRVSEEFNAIIEEPR